MQPKRKEVTFFVGNKPMQVPVGVSFIDTIQRLASNCNLGHFTLVVNGKTIEEGQRVPKTVTQELNELVMLIPYDRAAKTKV